MTDIYTDTDICILECRCSTNSTRCARLAHRALSELCCRPIAALVSTTLVYVRLVCHLSAREQRRQKSPLIHPRLLILEQLRPVQMIPLAALGQ